MKSVFLVLLLSACSVGTDVYQVAVNVNTGNQVTTACVFEQDYCGIRSAKCQDGHEYRCLTNVRLMTESEFAKDPCASMPTGNGPERANKALCEIGKEVKEKE